MFTILLATHNGEEWIAESLRCIMDQTYEDFECLVIDNGSSQSDRTQLIFRETVGDDDRFRYTYLDFGNKANALNYAIYKTTKPWLAILDVDDLWLPEKLQCQAEYIQAHPDADVIGTKFSYFGYGDDVASKTPDLPTSHNDIVTWLDRCENPFATSSVVYRRSLHFEGVGLYDTMYYSVEDYEIWKKCRALGRQFVNLPLIGMKHRIHPPSPHNITKRQIICKYIIDVLFTDMSRVDLLAHAANALREFDSSRPERKHSDGHSVRDHD